MKYFSHIIFLTCFYILLSAKVSAQPQQISDSIEHVFIQARTDTQTVNALNRMFNKYFYTNPQKALVYTEKALLIAVKLNYKAGCSNCFNNLGAYNYSHGNTEKAFDYYMKAIMIYKEIGDSLGIAYCLNNIGNIYFRKGNLEKTLDYWQQSLSLKEMLNDKIGISGSLNNIAAIYSLLGNSEKALFYHKKAYEIRKELNDERSMAMSLINIGITYKDLGDTSTCIDYYTKALYLRKSIDDKAGIAASLNSLAVIYDESENKIKALDYYVQSLKISEDIGDKEAVITSLINIGSLYTETGKYDSALIYNEKCLILSREVNAKQRLKKVYENFSKTYYRLGKYKMAYDYYQQYSDIKDSLLNEASSKQLTEISTKYETEKKEKEIVLLKKDKEVQALEIERKRILIYAFSLGFGLILLLAIALLRGYYQKKKANSILYLQKEEINAQKDHIEQIHKEITESIHYARNIQRAILPSVETANDVLCEHFILYKPKDIVSGDFYWFTKINGWLIFCAADCTGHGVPGAFMSMLGVTFLDEIVNDMKITRPDNILNELRKRIINALQQKGSMGEQKDGMDISLCAIDTKASTLLFSGANNPLYYVREGNLTEIKGDKMPIAIYETMLNFNLHEIKLQKNDIIYVFSDGFADQFGGIKGKKFKYEPLKKLLVSISNRPMNAQREALDIAFQEWKGDLEQVDDVCIIGVRYDSN
ncbi:MAG: hypothetical protein A2033_15950 [Bacteroidetes bacterium GWA2_31_9]|nr:MAG: hypothetical protein A2033_15950 [Bacteroidetes bacterium GWA2_31_9]